jgi:hypothetical protein
MVGRALWEGPESVSVDCAECSLKYLKDGEKQLECSGDKEQNCECKLICKGEMILVIMHHM